LALTERAQLLLLPWAAVRTPALLPHDAHLRNRRFFLADHAPSAPFRKVRGPLHFWRLRHQDDRARTAQEADPGSEPAADSMRPLRGLRVLDLTCAVAGPLAAWLLARLGASVLRVVQPHAQQPEPDATSELEAWLAGGKLVEPIDLASEPTRAAFWQRCGAAADVVMDNFSVRVMDNWQLSPERLLKERPDRIVVRMPAFGLSGPCRDWVAYGPTLEAWSGYASVFGESAALLDGRFAVSVSDVLSAFWAVLGVLAALGARRRSGMGMLVEVSQFESLCFLLATQDLWEQENLQSEPTSGIPPFTERRHACPAISNGS
jgi:crotonobetainyl-CoA:carnitine CoA-transferase CaiB-like acyl-CoA transferase